MFRLLIEVGLVVWIGLVILKKEYFPKFSPLLWALAIFLLIVGIANLVGVDPYSSLWSRYERMEGYFGLIHFGLYTLIAMSVLKTKKDWTILLNIFIGTGVAIGIYALFQRMGMLSALQGGRLRVDGTIGNPTYLGAYLIFILAIVAMMIAKFRNKIGRYIYGGIGAFLLLILYFTASRGPLLSLMVACAVWPVVYLIGNRFIRREKEYIYKRFAWIMLSVVIVIPIAFIMLRNTSVITENPTFSRIANISLVEKTTRSRLMIWGMAWEGFKERPVLGWGQENFPYVFSKFYNPNLFDQEPWFDRSHNIFLDWLINAGSLGLLSYLSLFGVLFWSLWHAVRLGKISLLEASVLVSGFIAYLFQNIFVFDNFNTYLVFFTLLSYVCATSTDIRTVAVHHHKSPKEQITNIQGSQFLMVMITLSVGVGLVAYWVNIKPMAEAASVIHALQLLGRTQNADEILSQFRKTLSYNTFGDGEVREQFTRLATSLASQTGTPIEIRSQFIESAVRSAEAQVKRFPNDLRSRLGVAMLYNTGAIIKGQEYIMRGRAHINTALMLSPTRQTVYFVLADNYILGNDFENAIRSLEQAVALAPHNMEAQANLGRIGLLSGRLDIGTSVFEAMKRYEHLLNPNTVPYLASFADVYIGIGKLSEALAVYKLILAHASGANDEIRYYMNAADLALRMNDRTNALLYAEAARALDPENFGSTIDAFLEKL